MRSSGPLTLAGLAVLLFAAGCTGSEGGTATPGTSNTTSVAESTSPKPSSTRPREIKLDGKDPCSLLTKDQLLQLAFNRPGRSGTEPTLKSPYCAWTVSGPSVQVITVTNEGIEAWTSGKRTGQPQEIAPVVGFPALTVAVPSDESRCDVLVDVANGQYLLVNYSVISDTPDRFPKPCDGGRQVAEVIMQNLVK